MIPPFDFGHKLSNDRSQTLAVTADLRATQIAQVLSLYRDLAQAVSTRSGVQDKLKAFNEGNDTQALLTDLEVRKLASGASYADIMDRTTCKTRFQAG